MIDTAPNRTVAEYCEMHRGIDVAQGLIRERISETDVPSTGEEFCELITGWHRDVFSAAFGQLAGRFRRPDELVEVGHNAHKFTGVDGAKIASSLTAAWEALGTRALRAGDRRAAAQWAADFCQRFFRIHPFADGNGRIGRLVVELVAERHGLAVVWPSFQKRKEETAARNDYIDALEYAHRKLGVTAAGHDMQDRAHPPPLAPLARWWERRIVSRQDMLDPDADELGTIIDGTEGDLASIADYAARKAQHAAEREVWLGRPEVAALRLPIVSHVSRKHAKHAARMRRR
jgi:fido (protein-threonine AMPylation protein)